MVPEALLWQFLIYIYPNIALKPPFGLLLIKLKELCHSIFLWRKVKISVVYSGFRWPRRWNAWRFRHQRGPPAFQAQSGRVWLRRQRSRHLSLQKIRRSFGHRWTRRDSDTSLQDSARGWDGHVWRKNIWGAATTALVVNRIFYPIDFLIGNGLSFFPYPVLIQ